MCSLELFMFIGYGFESSEYLDLICDESLSVDSLALIGDYLYESGVDGIFLTDLRRDALLLDVLSKWCVKEGRMSWRRHWQFLLLNGDFESYVNSLSKNMRYNLHRRTRNFNKAG